MKGMSIKRESSGGSHRTRNTGIAVVRHQRASCAGQSGPCSRLLGPINQTSTQGSNSQQQQPLNTCCFAYTSLHAHHSITLLVMAACAVDVTCVGCVNPLHTCRLPGGRDHHRRDQVR